MLRVSSVILAKNLPSWLHLRKKKVPGSVMRRKGPDKLSVGHRG